MTIATEEQNVFRPVRTKSLAKSDITNEAARAIIRTEAERQYAKTTRLREARLAMQALQPAAVPETKARVRKADKKITTAPGNL